MRLRSRLALTSLLAALPLVAGASWYRAHQAWNAEESRVASVGLSRLENDDFRTERPQGGDRGGRPPREDRLGPRGRPGPERGDSRRGDSRRGEPRRAERGGDPRPRNERGPRSDPARRPPPRTEITVFDADFEWVEGSPATFPNELRAALEGGADRASIERPKGRGFEFHVALRTPWPEASPAVLLVTRRADKRIPRAQDFLTSGLLAGGLVLLVSILAAGPLVGRIRRLTQSIDAAHDDDPAAPIVAEHLKGNDEVSDLAAALERSRAAQRGAREDLTSRERTLRRFVDNTTHDVAIPLTVLQSHLVALAKDQPDSPALHGAIQEAHYVAAILRNLTTVARLETGEAEFERAPINLSELVARCVSRHVTIADQAGIQLHSAVPPDPLFFHGNVTLLEEALSNLIHNALRYNSEGGQVAVVLGTSARADDRAFWLRVVDDGPGIPAGKMAALMERSGRGDAARERHPDGRGLGLHIVRDVAERHGLGLAFEAGDDGGLQVTLRGSQMD